jgi:hypothetical protein
MSILRLKADGTTEQLSDDLIMMGTPLGALWGGMAGLYPAVPRQERRVSVVGLDGNWTYVLFHHSSSPTGQYYLPREDVRIVGDRLFFTREVVTTKFDQEAHDQYMALPARVRERIENHMDNEIKQAFTDEVEQVNVEYSVPVSACVFKRDVIEPVEPQGEK